MYILADKRKATHNSTLAIGGVSSPLDIFGVNQTLVLRINICAEKPPLRQAAGTLAVILTKATIKINVRKKINS
jgi:hypothetical protein